MSLHDQTTPAALHKLIGRLLDDHRRIYPHHADLCQLCQDTNETLDLLADEVPDDGAVDEAGDDEVLSLILIEISRHTLADSPTGGSYRARPPN